jgi:hypothetical protein
MFHPADFDGAQHGSRGPRVIARLSCLSLV